MPFDGFPGFTAWDPEEDDLTDPCYGKDFILEFKRDDERIYIIDSPDHGIYAVYSGLLRIHNIYYMDSLQVIIPIVPSLLNTDWEVIDYNAEFVSDQFDAQLPDAVTTLEG